VPCPTPPCWQGWCSLIAEISLAKAAIRNITNLLPNMGTTKPAKTLQSWGGQLERLETRDIKLPYCRLVLTCFNSRILFCPLLPLLSTG
jgi:hypothetical protein